MDPKNETHEVAACTAATFKWLCAHIQPQRPHWMTLRQILAQIYKFAFGQQKHRLPHRRQNNSWDYNGHCQTKLQHQPAAPNVVRCPNPKPEICQMSCAQKNVPRNATGRETHPLNQLHWKHHESLAEKKQDKNGPWLTQFASLGLQPTIQLYKFWSKNCNHCTPEKRNAWPMWAANEQLQNVQKNTPA